MSSELAPPRTAGPGDSLAGSVLGYRGPPTGSVDLWWASVDDLAPEHLLLLNSVERGREEAYMRAADRDRFVLGVALSRYVLGATLSTPPAEVPLARECPDCERAHGRPHLVAPPGQPAGPMAGLDFSISHSGHWLLMLIGRGVRVGADIEEIVDAPDLPSLARQVLSPSELAEVQPGGVFNPTRFFQQWVAKESALKATGLGMRMPMNEVTVMPLAQPSGPVEFSSRPGAAATVHRLDAPVGYAAAATTLTADTVPIRISRRHHSR